MKLNLSRVLIIICLFLFTYSTNAQNTLGNGLFGRQIVTADTKCRNFTVGGRQISYDSCKRLLLTFPSSALELNRVLRLDARLNSAYPMTVAFAIPALGFIIADQVTHQNTPWVHISAISLDVLFLADVAYLVISDKHRRKHLRAAIDLYNAEVKKSE